MKINSKVSLLVLLLLASVATRSAAQSSAFTYQGRLTDGGAPANGPGPYQMQFTLFSSAVGGDPLGPPIQIDSVDVVNGVFTVQVDFGGAGAFDGHLRWLQIAVKKPTDHLFSLLTPRQPITSTPYAIKSLNAVSADTATNSTQLGGVAASQYVVTTDLRMTDARSPSSGSDNYIQNTTNEQPANFDIGGSGHIGGVLRIEGNALPFPESSSLSISANGSFQVDAAFVQGGRFVVQNDGNVGIGTPFATEKLDVAGNIKFSGAITGNGSGLTNVTPQTTTNLSLLGSLRWDLLGQNNFAVGSVPEGVAFDGTNIWVANHNNNNVTKLRASDGACAGVVGPPTAACTFAVGTGPRAVAFDGVSIWVANQSSNNVTKLRASDGACAGVVGPPTPACTFATGPGPFGVAFDGANIWVANSNSSNVTKLRASDGACAGVVGPPTAACTFAVGVDPVKVAFDGANIWVANFISSNVTKLRTSDGACAGVVGPPTPACTFAVGAGPFGVAFDGANMWIANEGSTTVTKLRASDGACAGVVGPPAAACTFAVGAAPAGVAFDGANIWVANSNNNNVTKLRASDGACAGVVGPPTAACTFAVGTGPFGVAFDGANIWVTNSDSTNVTKLPAFP